jgi:Arc/MetJ-type ribon-helix-helix transcriptional regulator
MKRYRVRNRKIATIPRARCKAALRHVSRALFHSRSELLNAAVRRATMRAWRTRRAMLFRHARFMA